MQASPRHYQQLQPEDRVAMASLQQNRGQRDIATALNCAPSAIETLPRQRVLPLPFLVPA